MGAQIALDVLTDANAYNNISDCEIVEVIQMNNLQEIWSNLDEAYEYMERAIEEMSYIPLSKELYERKEQFDLSGISYMKQFVEEMMENNIYNETKFS